MSKITLIFDKVKLIKTYKYKLKPTKSQVKTFDSWINICRYVYNSALEHRITSYKSAGVSVSKYEQYNELPAIKKELPWMAAVHSDVLQESLDRVDKAYKSFFKGSGFPKFQKKGFYRSFTYKRSFKVSDKHIKLPKIGEVKYFNSRPIPEGCKTKIATITKELDGYYISICIEFPPKPTLVDNSQAVGVDAGIVHFATLSDGKFIDSPYFLEPNLVKLRLLQRRLNRQKKGSNSREKTKHQIAKLHMNIRRKRSDYLHKTSTNLVLKYSAVYVENLKIRNMTKLNSTLSRRMLDNGFYSFRRFLDYKCRFAGKNFEAVPPHYTSQTCTDCGDIDKRSRISQSEFVCTSCGFMSNADLLASKNIRDKGIVSST